MCVSVHWNFLGSKEAEVLRLLGVGVCFLYEEIGRVEVDEDCRSSNTEFISTDVGFKDIISGLFENAGVLVNMSFMNIGW